MFPPRGRLPTAAACGEAHGRATSLAFLSEVRLASACRRTRTFARSGKPSDRDAITVAGDSTTDTRLQPSTLLLRGWTRAAAVDAEGRIVTPGDPSAMAWSIWGALNRAYQPGGDAWRAAWRHLADIIAEREGGCAVSAQLWNRAAGRTHGEILSVSDEIQRRLRLELRPA